MKVQHMDKESDKADDGGPGGVHVLQGQDGDDGETSKPEYRKATSQGLSATHLASLLLEQITSHIWVLL